MTAARRAVAIGGGTGMPLVLSCLVDLGFDTSAVVTTADDGGSSGMLREQLGMLPPGDARNCLIALAEPGNPLAEVFAYRFPHGEGLAGHALGNLVIAALADIEGGFAEALDAAGALLHARGRVLPSTLTDVRLHAEDSAGRPVAGQANIARSTSALARVYLEPGDAVAYPTAVTAIEEADVVVMGPGSLFTSLVPNLLVPGIAEALARSRAKRVYVCNVANQRGETAGMDAYAHVSALRGYVGEALDVVLVNDAARLGGSLLGNGGAEPEIEMVDAGPDVVARIRREGLDVTVADVADEADRRHHSREKLRKALTEVL